MTYLNVTQDLLTVRDFIRWGTSRFTEAGLCYGHGTDNPLDEAAWLVLHTLHLPTDLDGAWLDCRLSSAERRLVMERLLLRIHTRKPVAYITHEAYFANLSFYVDERVLIPRSPLAEFIEQGLEAWVKPEQVQRILDIGTGSGCIGIACAYAFPHAQVDLVDISPDALAVAEKNIQRHQLAHRVRARQSDVYSALDHATFDLIITNPPYVDAHDMAALSEEFRYEPVLGLAAGDDGLEVILRILKDACAHLSPHGVLIGEVGNSAEALVQRLPDVPFTWLEFARGGHGVFIIEAKQLAQCVID